MSLLQFFGIIATIPFLYQSLSIKNLILITFPFFRQRNSGTRTLDLGMTRQVFYHYATGATTFSKMTFRINIISVAKNKTRHSALQHSA
jgi:hypothetical protein